MVCARDWTDSGALDPSEQEQAICVLRLRSTLERKHGSEIVLAAPVGGAPEFGDAVDCIAHTEQVCEWVRPVVVVKAMQHGFLGAVQYGYGSKAAGAATIGRTEQLPLAVAQEPDAGTEPSDPPVKLLRGCARAPTP